MSTRSQIVIKDRHGELWFYRHSDGYPSGNLPQLRQFLQWVREGFIRDNAEQSAGWLIVLGLKEYAHGLLPETPKNRELSWDAREEKANKITIKKLAPVKSIMGWKVGAYEPCSCRELHGDVEWLYTIDLTTRQIKIKEIYTGKEMIDRPELTPEEMEKLFSEEEEAKERASDAAANTNSEI